jgi:large subunit ribosomal protein L3
MPPKAPLNWGLLPPAFLLPSSIRALIPAQPAAAATSYTCIRTIKSTNTPRPDRFAHRPGKPALNSTSAAALERKAHSTPLRTGLLALKRGMTAIYDPTTGKRAACTVLQLDRNVVVAHKTREKNGYWAVQIGAGQKEARNVTKPMLGHFAKAETAPKRWVVEFKVKGQEGLGVQVGESVGAGWFKEGMWVDVRGISRGMGFAGVSSGLFQIRGLLQIETN